jgi:CubicO group peptidase (beta-lactamase class C family)
MRLIVVCFATLLLLAAAPSHAALAPPTGPVPAAAPPVADPAENEAEASTPPVTSATDAAPALTRTDLEAWMDGFLPYALDRGDIAGAVVVVVKDGEVLLQKGYGWSDLEARTPVDPEQTLFRPGSVSKLFTWTAVMQLVEQGKLDLDRDVNDYLDFEIPPRDGKPVTLRQVMTHTAGFEEQVRALIGSTPEYLVPLGDALKHWVPERIFDAGRTPAYSNYATGLAGYIIERVTGETFDDYIDKNVLHPLGMRNSSFRQPLPDDLLAKMSVGYSQASDGQPRPYEFINLAPAGSLAASGADMGRFMIAHLQGGELGDARILSAETANQMHSTASATIPPLNSMMLGFYETTINGRRAIAHGGDTQWFHSDLQLFLDDGIGLFISVNSSGREGAPQQIRGALAREFANRYLPGPHAGGTGETVSEEDAKLHAQQIAGHYASSRRADSTFISVVYLLGGVSVVANEDGTISVPMLTSLAGAPRKWREISPYVWQDTASGERLAAEVVEGKVVRFSVDQLAPIMEFHRQSWWQSSSLLLPLMLASLFALAATVIAWPVSALVRRHYRTPYALGGSDARAHRRIRWVALAVLLAFGGMLGLTIAMMSSLEMMGAGSDGIVIAMRLLVAVVLPLGALMAISNAWQVLRSRRRLLAKLWSIVLALSVLVLLWISVAYHLIGFGANY